MGGYAPPPGASPVLGLEVSGTVDAVGSGVGAEWLGRALCSLTAGAGYSEWVCVPVEHCMPIPSGWTWAQAAAFPEAKVEVRRILVVEPLAPLPDPKRRPPSLTDKATADARMVLVNMVLDLEPLHGIKRACNLVALQLASGMANAELQATAH